MDQAVRAVSRLNGKVPGLEFHVVGDGDDLGEFRELSGNLGVEGIVHFRGRVPLEGLIPTLEGMDLGIIPNERNLETELMLPVKMLECVALGIPVVVPRLKTIEHYFTEDMGFYFQPDDIDSMAEAIHRTSVSLDERLNKAREARRFLAMHGWESHKNDFIRMYRSLGN